MFRLREVTPEGCDSSGIDDVIKASLFSLASEFSPNTGKLNPVMFTALHPDTARVRSNTPLAMSIGDFRSKVPGCPVIRVIWCWVIRISSALSTFN